MDDYDEYRVPPAPMRFATPDTTPFFAQSFTQNTLSLPFRDILRQRDFFSTSRRFFSYRQVDNLPILSSCYEIN